MIPKAKRWLSIALEDRTAIVERLGLGGFRPGRLGVLDLDKRMPFHDPCKASST